MADLHAVVLGEIDRHERVSGPGLKPVFDALRATVQRHGDNWGVCTGCSDLQPYPCDDLRAIARDLGVTT